jgi:hypothetical protein
MRMPEIARLMTSCWICSVPSKMSWVWFGPIHWGPLVSFLLGTEKMTGGVRWLPLGIPTLEEK